MAYNGLGVERLEAGGRYCSSVRAAEFDMGSLLAL